jgi:hypothetical protein
MLAWLAERKSTAEPKIPPKSSLLYPNPKITPELVEKAAEPIVEDMEEAAAVIKEELKSASKASKSKAVESVELSK